MEISLIKFDCEIYAVVKVRNELTGNGSVQTRKVSMNNTIKIDGKEYNVGHLHVNQIEEEWI